MAGDGPVNPHARPVATILRRMARWLTIAVAGGAAFCLFAAGCGGGSTPTYSRAAFKSCLDTKSFHVIPSQKIPGKGFKTILSIAPDLIVGYFPDKEYAVFIFMKDAKAAEQVATKINDLRAKDTATTAASISQIKNLVVVLPENAVITNTVERCENSSLVK